MANTTTTTNDEFEIKIGKGLSQNQNNQNTKSTLLDRHNQNLKESNTNLEGLRFDHNHEGVIEIPARQRVDIESHTKIGRKKSKKGRNKEIMAGKEDDKKDGTSVDIREQGNVSMQCQKLTETMETILKAYCHTPSRRAGSTFPSGGKVSGRDIVVIIKMIRLFT
ncbi:hypothetical protein E3N88_35015 [Mikania micrantha]|uniref:Uncharacterized protein n=1 Tax=Mikania micrantha TaxID=192012 RepID=A0A5N6LZT3_9ASTR|nr:hypothetical protein E3N88_35015 [Mikania micrantha]